MRDALIVSALSVVPRKAGARTMGWLARSPLSRLATRAFVWAYGVDLSEAEGELEDYPTLEALFTRTLREGARPIAQEPELLVSPVDATCAYVGRSVEGEIEVAPGRSLALSTLLDRPVQGELDAVVLYLSPTDYHRVHVPREGLAVAWRYVPGTLWPVFPAAVRTVENLFARNERVVVEVQTHGGQLDVVLVGAFGVGRISLALCDLITNTGGQRSAAVLEPGVPLTRGAPLGVFHLGSTVILCAEPGRWRWSVEPGASVRVGAPLGSVAGVEPSTK